MKKKLKKPSIKTVNHRDGGMSFYAEGGEFDFVRNQTPNVPTNFEQRMYHTPHIDNEDGSMSSHKMMSWSDENGEHSAPTIVYQNGQLVELTPDEAIDYAYKNGEMKTFNTFQENLDYGNNGYKTGTPMELFLQNPEFEPNALYGGRNSYAAGGPINPSWPKPTATDSLNLYNNAVKVLDYYRKNDSYKELPPSYNYKNLFLELNKAKKGFDDKNKKKEIQYPTREGRSTTGSIPSSMYYEKLSPYQFKQREAANSVLDTRSPMSFYDLRISPSAYYDFSNENENDSMRADQIGIYGYDPIAIKPDKLLTPAERKLREKRYGKPKSINDSKVVEETSGPKVVREIPAPLNPAYKPRTTGIPFLLSDEVVNTTTPMTPSVPVASATTTSKTPMIANPTKWFSLDGSGNKVLIDNQYLTRDEFEKFKVANPNFNYSQKPDSVGRKYNMGGGIELSNRMFEEGGEYELTNEEIRDLQSQGYDIELL